MGNPVPTINLQAQAVRELQNDVLTIEFTATESGVDPAVVQEELRKKLADALTVIRPLLKKDEVETETGSLSIYPRYNKKNEISGYQGQVLLTVKGTDTASISGLASKITTMVVSGTSNSLSRKLRKSVEKELVNEAIAAFCEQAQQAVSAFGYAVNGYEIGNVDIQVAQDRSYYGSSLRSMRPMAGAALEATPLEVEGGKAEVNVRVTGSVIIKWV